MKENFNLGLTLEQREVTQKIGINNVENMDNKLFKEVYGILDSVKKRVQKVIDKYYVGSQKTEEKAAPAPGNSGGEIDFFIYLLS